MVSEVVKMANSKEVFAKNIQNLLKIHNSTREEVAKFLGVKYTTFVTGLKVELILRWNTLLK